MGKYWCFTWNNFQEDYIKYFENLKCNYFIIGKEIGESGTPHLQGYIEFASNIRFEALKKINSEVHWERRIGSAEQASTYCRKDGDFIEHGTMSSPQQGKRTDLDSIRDLVNEGKGMKDIIEVCSNYQSIRSAEILLKYKEVKRTWKPTVYWYWGPTGCGKTRKATELAPDAYVSGKNLRWWEGYDAHEDVIIDDFRKDFCTFHELLRILDRYEYRIEVKGSSRQLLAKRIFITSCYKPEDVYDTREDIAQLLRRIDNIELITNQDFVTTSVIEVGGNTSPDIYGEI